MFEVRGTAYRQNPGAPWLFSFVEFVGEVEPYCGVPRKEEDYLSGFQRSLDADRVDDIRKFWDERKNSSPTSICLGVHQGSELVFDDGTEGDIRPATLKVDIGDIKKTVQQIAKEVSEALKERLPDTDSDNDGDEDVGQEENPPEESEEEEGELDFGTSALEELIDHLDNEEWVKDPENEEFILDLGKPILVIDGQHRLLGTDQAIGNIPFNFVALHDVDWPEMIFQFCIINYTAKTVGNQDIVSNAVTSLTNDELQVMQNRLSLTGLVYASVDIDNRCYHAEEAAFHGAVKLPWLTAEVNNDKMGKVQIDRMAKVWRAGGGSFLYAMKEALYPGMSAGERTKEWQDTGDWAKAFNLFWDIFKSKFETYVADGEDPKGDPGDPFWGAPGSNLNKTGVLRAFQDSWLKVANSSHQMFKTSGIDQFDGKDPWEVLENKVKVAIKKASLRRMLENEWSLTQTNTQLAKDKLRAQFDKACRQEPLNWTSKSDFTA